MTQEHNPNPTRRATLKATAMGVTALAAPAVWTSRRW